MARRGKRGLRVPTTELRVQVREKAGRITTAGRRALPASEFGLPDGRRPGTAGDYPIDTVARARNALARSAQAVKHGRMSGATRRGIHRRVCAKYPSIRSCKK